MRNVLFLLIIISQANAFAQVEISYLSGIGTINIVPGNPYSKGLGYTTGGIVEYPIFKEHLFIKSGLFFSGKGAYYPIYHSYDHSILGKLRENVYYLESPIQLQFRFLSIFKLQAGIYNAVRLNTAGSEDGLDLNSFVQYNNRHDIGYIAGLNFGYKRFIFEVNYLKSIKSLGKGLKWDSGQNKYVLSNDTRFYNQNLFFTIGYKIWTGSSTKN